MFSTPKIPESQLPFHHELLESRLHLAGNVTASMNASGDVTVVGDNLSNHVSIQVTPAGNLEVSGVGTTVNGLASDILPLEEFGQVRGELLIRMRGGDDTISINNLESSGFVFRGGAGNDHAMVTTTLVDGRTQFFGESGDDTIELIDFLCPGDIVVNTAGGDDVVTLVGVHSSRRDLKLNLGSGNDLFTGSSVSAKHVIGLLGGAGNDHLNALVASANRVTLNAGAGHDTVYAGEFVAPQQTFVLGAGEDLASVHSAEFDELTLLGGSGDDMLFALSATGTQLSVVSGAGDDHVGVACGQMTNASLQTGSGEDWLMLGDPEIKHLQANTAGGNDHLVFGAVVIEETNATTAGGNDSIFYGSAASALGTVNGSGGLGDVAWVDPAAVVVPALLSTTVVDVATDLEIDMMLVEMADIWVARGGLLADIQC